MKKLQFNFYQCGAGRRWGGTGWVGSKMSIPILAPSHGAGLKSHPIPAPLLLRGGKKLPSGAGQNYHS